MSNTKRKPLLSDEFLGTLAPDPEMPDGPKWYPSSTQVRNIYEADRAKDAELIQMAVDMAHSRAYEWTDPEFRAALMDTELAFLAAAEAAGFKPTEG